MSKSYFLGVDGGGTKTRFAIIDSAGDLLAQSQLGTTYHPEIGLDGVREVLSQGIDAVLQQAQIRADALGFAFFGLPAHGEDSRATAALNLIPASVLGHERYACDNDTVCGWAGSLACQDGINVVAGTGSIGYGQRQGVGARAGGWGEAFSDEGSAHWIAMQGLNVYSRMSDGRLPKGALHGIFNSALKIEHDLDICALIYGPEAYTRGDVAQLSPLVAQAAREGDVAARGIFTLAGQELARIVDALRVSLGFQAGETVPVSYSGGAFSAGELLLTPFHDALRAAYADYDVRLPLYDPHYGAALYASKLAGRRTADTQSVA